MMKITGMGWASECACGSLAQERDLSFENFETIYEKLFTQGYMRKPLAKNRAFSRASRRACVAVAMALESSYQGNFCSLDEAVFKTGIISLNREGSLHDNWKYYKDYLDSGRTMARGNLFVYTLPTSPSAEVAMNFGLKGPVYHVSERKNLGKAFTDRVEVYAFTNKNSRLLGLFEDRDLSLAMMLIPSEESGDKVLDLHQVAALFDSELRLHPIIEKIKAKLRDQKEARSFR